MDDGSSGAGRLTLGYIVPIALSAVRSAEELARRAAYLATTAGAWTDVHVVELDTGLRSVESQVEEALIVPPILECVGRIGGGYDALIIGCFGDPGLDAAREATRTPVVGPAQAACLLASSLGYRFSVVTVLDRLVPILHQLVERYGLDRRLASVRSIDVPVTEVGRDASRSVDLLVEAGRRAVAEDGADTLVLGCMSLGFLGAHDAVADAVGVPVVNPVTAAVAMAQANVRAGLSHSARAYPPPKHVAHGP